MWLASSYLKVEGNKVARLKGEGSKTKDVIIQVSTRASYPEWNEKLTPSRGICVQICGLQGAGFP